MEYTNAISQFAQAKRLYNEAKGSTTQATLDNIKQRKAKFISIPIYIICTIIALIIAYRYFGGIENGWLKSFLIILAGIFNIPFLGFYAVWHVALENPAPSYSREEFKADRLRRLEQIRSLRRRPEQISTRPDIKIEGGLTESLVRTLV